MSTERELLRRERLVLKEKYGDLFTAVSEALFKADLQGINFETNTDEYEPEAGTIIPRLGQANGQQDVVAIVREEFCRWFGPEEAAARRNYEPVAKQIWEAWCALSQRDA